LKETPAERLGFFVFSSCFWPPRKSDNIVPTFRLIQKKSEHEQLLVIPASKELRKSFDRFGSFCLDAERTRNGNTNLSMISLRPRNQNIQFRRKKSQKLISYF
jgi:hypothetical protein